MDDRLHPFFPSRFGTIDLVDRFSAASISHQFVGNSIVPENFISLGGMDAWGWIKLFSQRLQRKFSCACNETAKPHIALGHERGVLAQCKHVWMWRSPGIPSANSLQPAGRHTALGGSRGTRHRVPSPYLSMSLKIRAGQNC